MSKEAISTTIITQFNQFLISKSDIFGIRPLHIFKLLKTLTNFTNISAKNDNKFVIN